MQYTQAAPALTTLHTPPPSPAVLAALEPHVPTPTGCATVALRHLLSLFATVPDPRRVRGRRYSVAAILAAILAALLCHHLAQLAAAAWLRDQSPAAQRALGFLPGHTPHQSTFNRLLRRLDPTALATAFRQLLDPPVADRPRASQGVACDGKAQRGRLPFQPPAPGTSPIHEIAAYCVEAGTVLAAVPVTSTVDKAAAELNSAPALLAAVDWSGRVLTGDALWGQRSLCEQVVAAGGDYLLTVKANQGHLLAALQAWFAPDAPRRYGYAPPPADRREIATRDDGHGRLDIRYLAATTELRGVLDWPHVAQVFTVIRSWQAGSVAHQEQHWGITSLPPVVAGVERLLELRRGHWGIENSLHYVKDVTLGEDRSLIHCGTGPAIMSLLRDLVVSVLHRAGYRQIAARLRYHARHPEAALALLGCPIFENA